ncbi:MAG TPA: histidine kinase [Colwellia sp.]|nr:histidine kinase [Colwellia sp.]
MNQPDAYKIAFKREVKARELAEKLLEDKTRELYDNVLHLEGVIDELNVMQKQLIQSEKMASLGQLTAGIAHEINNPIGFSYSNISCLNDYLTDFFLLDDHIMNSNDLQLNEAELLKQYRQIHKKINADYLKKDIPILLKDTFEGLHRVKHIVENLKKISYKSNDKFTSFSINECINYSLKAVKNELKYSMDTTLELNDCPNIFGEASDLIQVFIILFINASQACEKKGHLFIKSSHEQDKVIISIRDNGKGIAEDNLHKIFDPFFTTKDIGAGTGLGLSISHGIMEKHCGKITVESKINQGTCFTITLPIEKRIKPRGLSYDNLVPQKIV